MKTESLILTKPDESKHPQVLRKETVFANEFQALAGNSSFLLFAVMLTVLACSCMVDIVRGYAAIETFLQGPVQALVVILIVEIVMGFLIGSVWNIVWDAKHGYTGKRSGVFELLIMHWVLLAILILGFAITLPIFTEMLTYSESYDAPLQIIYCGYVIVGAYVLVALGVLSKLQMNLTIWNGSTGPVMALLVMLIALMLILMVVFSLLIWTTTAVLLMLALICLVNLVMQYHVIVKKCEKL